MNIDHIGLLVTEIESAVADWKLNAPDAIEEFPSEGTREAYIGDPESSGRILLMQPIGPGPYADALSKRGPGLHHVAIFVENPEDFVGNRKIADAGWLLHSRSLELLKTHSQIWLCRPGIPFLVEIATGLRDYSAAHVADLSVAMPAGREAMIRVLGCSGLSASADGRTTLSVGDQSITL